MTVQIRLFATLRQIAGGASLEVPQAEGDTVGTLLTRLVDMHPALKSELFASNGQLQGHIHVIVNGRDVRFLDGLDTPVSANDQILVFPPVGGGAPMSTQHEGEPAASSLTEPAVATGELTRVIWRLQSTMATWWFLYTNTRWPSKRNPYNKKLGSSGEPSFRSQFPT